MSTYSAQLEAQAPVTHLGAALGAPQPLQLRLLRMQPLHLAFALCAIACGGGLAYVLYEGSQEIAVVLGVIAAVCALLAGLFWWRRQGQGGEVTFFEQGLSVARGGTSTALAWSELDALSVLVRDELFNGNTVGQLLQVEARAGARTLRFQHYQANQTPSELPALLTRALEQAADAAEAKLKAGGMLRGDGWWLDSAGLHTKGRSLVSLSEVRQAAVFEDKVSLWRGAEDEPFFQTPEGSANACLLHLVARRRVPADAGESQSSLGRVLFKKKLSRALVVILALLALAAAMPGVMLLRMSDDPVPGGSLLAFGALFALAGWWGVVARFQCHTRGVLKQGLFGTRVLKYADIQLFRYTAVRMYHNGAYTGTTVNFAFVPAAPEKPIVYGTSTRGNDADLDFLRDSVAEIVAGTLLRRLQAGEEIRWGKSAILTANELRYRESKLIGKGPERTARLDDDLRFSIQEGTFHLFVPGAPKSVLQIGCGEDNFYPGLIVFQQLCSDAHARRTAR